MKAYQKEMGHARLELNVCICWQLVYSRTTQAVNHHAPAQSAAKEQSCLSLTLASPLLCTQPTTFLLSLFITGQTRVNSPAWEVKRGATYCGLKDPPQIRFGMYSALWSFKGGYRAEARSCGNSPTFFGPFIIQFAQQWPSHTHQ